MKNYKLFLYSFLHALGTIIYIGIVATVLQNGGKMFGEGKSIIGPIAFLTIFILSAAITGSLILGKPLLLYLDNQKKDAIKLFGYTLGWLFVALIIIVISVQIINNFVIFSTIKIN